MADANRVAAFRPLFYNGIGGRIDLRDRDLEDGEPQVAFTEEISPPVPGQPVSIVASTLLVFASMA